MSRATLERRPTLDELFGPDDEIETEDVRREVDALIQAESKALRREINATAAFFRRHPGADFKACIRAMSDTLYRYVRLEWLKVQRHAFLRHRLDLAVLNRPLVEFEIREGKLAILNRPLASIESDAEGWPGVSPIDDGEEPDAKVTLGSIRGQWLIAIRSMLRDAFESSEDLDDIHRVLDRFAAFAQIAIVRCLSAIGDAIAALRRNVFLADPIVPSTLTPRQLIGKLLSPHVLAAGSGLGLFVTRC